MSNFWTLRINRIHKIEHQRFYKPESTIQRYKLFFSSIIKDVRILRKRVEEYTIQIYYDKIYVRMNIKQS